MFLRLFAAVDIDDFTVTDEIQTLAGNFDDGLIRAESVNILLQLQIRLL